MRNIMAYTLNILAGLLLLFCSVIPHHHHDNTICFNKCYSKTHDCIHKNDCCHEPSDNQTNQHEECLLKQVYTLNDIQEYFSSKEYRNQNYQWVILFIAELTQLPDIISNGLTIKYQCYDRSVPDACIMLNLSLRAPPAYC